MTYWLERFSVSLFPFIPIEIFRCFPSVAVSTPNLTSGNLFFDIFNSPVRPNQIGDVVPLVSLVVEVQNNRVSFEHGIKRL
jgi:hypothetical protein